MGIKSFNEFLKRYASNCYFEVPLEAFRGKRIAIDMHILIYESLFGATAEVVEMTNVAVSQPDQQEIDQNTMNRVINKLEIFMSYQITPVCVFDGAPNQLKEQTQTSRRETKDKKRRKLADAEDKLYSVDSLLRTQQLMNDYRKAFRECINPGRELYSQLKDLLISTGFPVLMADDFHLPTNDAEAICASLCLTGNDYCVATFTTDSDYHTYGGNLAITEYYAKYKTENGVRSTIHYAKVRSLEAILMQSGLTFSQFRDLCIMMGTDYNQNIRGIGPAKSMERIQQYGSVAEISRYLDTSILNYPNVFEIFNSSIRPLTLSNLDFNEERFRENGRQTFDLYGLTTKTDRILAHLE